MIRERLRAAEARLAAHDIPISYAKFILNELLLAQDQNLYLMMSEVLDATVAQRFDAMIDQVCTGVPLAYVLGYQSFYGYPIQVNPSVLIPRFETEELLMRVLQATDEHFEKRDLVAFDVATGSGALACALQCEAPELTVYASDISADALAQARINANALGAAVQFFEGDMLKPFLVAGLQADIIVCNPPYIPEDEVPEASVLDHEPHLALFGGPDGLKFYRQFFDEVHPLLKEHALLAFEMGHTQAEALRALAHGHFPNARIEVYPDLQGKDRILLVRCFAVS
jgi:release factor glutamine methyltransferase